MAAVSMENRLPDSEPLANATSTSTNPSNTERSKLLKANSTDTTVKSERSTVKEAAASAPKRSKLSKALTLPAEGSSSSTERDSTAVRSTIQILPRTSQYEKHPLLQERTASGLSELEQFLLERDTPTSKTFSVLPEQSATSSSAGTSSSNSRSSSSTSTCNTTSSSSNTSSSSSSNSSSSFSSSGGGDPKKGAARAKLEPRGAHYERHALLVKTSSGRSELEQLLLEKEKQLQKKDKKSKKGKGPSAGFDISPQKLLWIKRGVSVEKAKSFEKTACLEKAKSVDQSLNVSRARSLEEESNLERGRPRRLARQKSAMESTVSKDNPQVTASPDVVCEDNTSNPTGATDERTDAPKQNCEDQGEKTTAGNPPSTTGCSHSINGAVTGSPERAVKTDTPEKRTKLFDLALRPNLEWREDDQHFVVFVQSPVSPPDEKPDNLLICYDARKAATVAGSLETAEDDQAASIAQESTDSPATRQIPPYEKPKKYVHPSVIDSDPDSEGMVCMDELESIDFGLSSPEPSPRKQPSAAKEPTPLESSAAHSEGDEPTKDERENVPLIDKERSASVGAEGIQAQFKQKVPVDAMSAEERARRLSLKRASLGQLEPRIVQYAKHPLLEQRDEDGLTPIEKLLEEHDEQRRQFEERELEKEVGDLKSTSETSKEPQPVTTQPEAIQAAPEASDGTHHQPKASIRRVHFERSEAGDGSVPEIEQLGAEDIEPDPTSPNSTSRSNGSRKKGYRGGSGKSNKSSSEETPEEEKLLSAEGEDLDREVSQPTGAKNRCCCIS